MNRRFRSQKGLTMVELMAALAITAILTVTSLGIISNLWRQQKVHRSHQEDFQTRQALQRLLELDLKNAYRFRAIEDGLELKTRSVLDGGMNLRNQEGLVAYRILHIGSDSWLVRTQSGSSQAATCEPVCRGITGITLMRLDDSSGGSAANWQWAGGWMQCCVNRPDDQSGQFEVSVRTQ